MRSITILFLLIVHSVINAQDTTGSYRTIAELSSPSFKGRGYVGKGDSIAAQYIKDRFVEAGLKPFKDSYFQEFKHDVNVFAEDVLLKLDDNALVPGKDFIVDASCATIKLDAKVIIINRNNPYSSFLKIKSSAVSKAIIIIDSTGFDQAAKAELIGLSKEIPECRGLIWICNKLTWTVSPVSLPFPIFYVLKSSFPDKVSKASIDVKSQVIKGYASRNVKGYLVSKSKPDSFVFITAHYDHLGMMGNVLFPGASDNASGVSMLIELAEYYSKISDLPYSIVFIAFAGEEAGLVGSEYYVRNPVVFLKKMKLLINLDLVGNGEKGITVVNATEFPKEYKIIEELNSQNRYFEVITKRGKAANSDHYPFSEKGVHSFFIYSLGGTGNYHDPGDVPSTLTMKGYQPLMKLIIDLIAKV